MASPSNKIAIKLTYLSRKPKNFLESTIYRFGNRNLFSTDGSNLFHKSIQILFQRDFQSCIKIWPDSCKSIMFLLLDIKYNVTRSHSRSLLRLSQEYYFVTLTSPSLDLYFQIFCFRHYLVAMTMITTLFNRLVSIHISLKFFQKIPSHALHKHDSAPKFASRTLHHPSFDKQPLCPNSSCKLSFSLP